MLLSIQHKIMSGEYNNIDVCNLYSYSLAVWITIGIKDRQKRLDILKECFQVAQRYIEDDSLR
jgi:hypothetical protein